MSRTRNLAELILEVRQRADMVNSQFISDNEFARMLNQSWARLYEQLLATGEDYYLKYVDVGAPVGGFYVLQNYVASNGGFATDVYQIRGVDANYAGNMVVNVPRFNWEERNLYLAAPALTPYYPIVAYRMVQEPVSGSDAIELIPQTATGVSKLRVWYYPNPKVLGYTCTVINPGALLTDGVWLNVPLTGGAGTGMKATVQVVAGQILSVQITDLGSGYTGAFNCSLALNALYAGSPAIANMGVVIPDSLDGRGGWEEWVVVDSAIKALTKEESDTSQLEREAARIWAQISLAAANRDSGQSKRVVDVSYNTGMWPYTSVRFRR